MKITKMVKRLGRVINTGNYSTIKIEAEAEALLEEKDSVETVDQYLFRLVSSMLAKDLKRIKEKQSEKPTEEDK